MNYELIIKLARLANENPNNNEANAAARKVCSLIKEAKYQFSVTPVRGRSIVGDQPRTQRQSEPNVRSASNPSSRGFDWFYDMYVNDPPRYRPTEKQREYYSYGTYEPPKSSHKYESGIKDDDRYYVDPLTGERKIKEKEKRPLVCKVCKQSVMTAFVGLESMFTCFGCQWKDYKEEKENENA